MLQAMSLKNKSGLSHPMALSDCNPVRKLTPVMAVGAV
jgi:hypothetical protein